MKRALAAVAALLVAFAAVTWWALESGGVAVLRTQRPDGSLRTTHVWYADADGVTWIEAANPQREFIADLRRYPEALLKREGSEGSYRAEVSRTPEDHARVRALLREKYGARDAWVGLLADTSHSLAVKLHRLGP